MVSGFLTSPCDHSRIFSGEASEMRIALKLSGSLGFSKKLKMSRIWVFLLFFRCLVARRARFNQLDIETESLKLFDEHVEALGEARLQRVFAFDDRLVHA